MSKGKMDNISKPIQGILNMHEQGQFFFLNDNDWLQRESYQGCISVMPQPKQLYLGLETQL